MAFIAVLDASVLFPASLRDTLLWSAKADLYRVHITEDILEEVCRNLILKRDVAPEKADYLAKTIREEFCDVTDTRYRLLVSAMPINEKDRHVMAAAISSGAQVIVTQNLRHFPQRLLSPFNIDAQSADEFLVHLFHLDREMMAEVLLKQAGALRKPAKTVSDILNTLSQHAPTFVNLVREAYPFANDHSWSHMMKANSNAREVNSDRE